MKKLLAAPIAFLSMPLAASAIATKDKKFDVVYGVGVSAYYYDGSSVPGYRLVNRKAVLPAFVVAALRDFDGKRYEVGPMFVSNVGIGGDEGASVKFDAIGFGVMFALRGTTDGSESNWINGLGIGVAYSLDQNVQLRGIEDATKTQQVSGHAVAVVVTYSFGRK